MINTGIALFGRDATKDLITGLVAFAEARKRRDEVKKAQEEAEIKLREENGIEYDISYSCRTNDNIAHVSAFSGFIFKSKGLSRVIDFIIKDITEDGAEIDSLNISIKNKTDKTVT